jgi:hypothetical protein
MSEGRLRKIKLFTGGKRNCPKFLVKALAIQFKLRIWMDSQFYPKVISIEE